MSDEHSRAAKRHLREAVDVAYQQIRRENPTAPDLRFVRWIEKFDQAPGFLMELTLNGVHRGLWFDRIALDDAVQASPKQNRERVAWVTPHLRRLIHPDCGDVIIRVCEEPERS